MLKTVPSLLKLVPENSSIKYIYVLGESSAYGVPYQEALSFAKIIQYITSNNIDNKKIEIVNLAFPGCQISSQYLKYFLYRYTHPLHKGIILIYAGTNNLSYSKPKEYSFFYNFNLIQILSVYTSKSADFQYMYENILKLGKNFGDDIYVSTIAGNYAGFLTCNTSDLKKHKELLQNLDFIDKLYNKGEYKQALGVCFNNINKYNNASHIFYRVGKIYEKIGKNNEANYFYLKAVNIENSESISTGPRPTIYQNKIITFLANKYDVPCLDTFGKLYHSNEVIGFNFFIDKIHPTIRLNLMLGQDFSDLLSQKYKINKTNEMITEENLKKIFKFYDEDLFLTYVQALGEVFIYTYNAEILNQYAISQIQEYISIINKLNLTDTSKADEQKKTVEFLKKLLSYITISDFRETLRIEIKKIYYYGKSKHYYYAVDSNFNKMLIQNGII